MSDTSMSDANSQGSSTMSGLKETANQTYQEVKSRAREAMPRITENVRNQALDQAESAKEALASTGERLAQSLRESKGGDDNSMQAKLMVAAADAMADLSNQIRDRSFDQILDDVRSFARRNPGAFVAAAALTGFGLARFARASSRPSYDSQSYGSTGGSASSYGSGAYGSSSYGAGSFGAGSSSTTGSSSVGSSSGSGTGSGGDFTGSGSLGVGTGGGYGSSGMGGSVSTSGLSTTGDLDDEAGSIADDGMGGGTASGTSGSTSGPSGSGYDR